MSSTVSDKENEQNRPEESGQKRSFTVLFIYLLIDLIGFTLILPMFPSILDHFGQFTDDPCYNGILSVTRHFREFIGAPDTPRWNSVLFGGILSSMYSTLQFLSSPIFGSVSDLCGRKPMLILSSSGLALSYLVWVFSNSFTLFTLSRVIGGLCKTNIGLAAAVVSDVSSPRTRGRGMALIGVAFSLGFLCGPLVGVLFSMQLRRNPSHISLYSAPAMFALGLALLDVLFLILFFRETLPEEKRIKTINHGLRDALDLINPVSLFSFSPMQTLKFRERMVVKKLGFTYFSFLLVYSALEFTLSFLTHIRFQYSSVEQGKMFCILGLIMICVQGGFVRRISPGSEKRMALLGMMCAMPAFIILGCARSLAWFHLGLVLFAIASAAVVPCLTSLVSLNANESQQGRLLGILRSLGSLARAIGPLLGSALFWSLGPSVTYVLGSIFILIPILSLKKIPC